MSSGRDLARWLRDAALGAGVLAVAIGQFVGWGVGFALAVVAVTMFCAMLRVGSDDTAATRSPLSTVQVLRAIETDDAEQVGSAIASGLAPINGPLPHACGITVAQLAALLGKTSSLRKLHDLGADLIECHPNRMLGGCCLHAAALGSHEPILNFLLTECGLYDRTAAHCKASLNSPLLNGMTALFLAAQAGHIAIVRRLIEAGADATIGRRDGTSCLFVAAKNGHTDVVAFLLSLPGLRAQLQEVYVERGYQYSGCTPVWVCAEKGHVDALQMLLEPASEMADAHARNVAGVTPLMVAADCGHYSAVQLLLQHCDYSDIVAVDCNGNTAYEFAIDQGHSEIAAHLQDAMQCFADNEVVVQEKVTGAERLLSKSQIRMIKLGQCYYEKRAPVGDFDAKQIRTAPKTGNPYKRVIEEPQGLMRNSWRCGVRTTLHSDSLRASEIDDDDAILQSYLDHGNATDTDNLFQKLEATPDNLESEWKQVTCAIEESCSQMHGTFLKVTAIYKINNPSIDMNYENAVSLLHSPLENARNHLFHGTTAKAILSICQCGFDPEHASFRGGVTSGAPKMFGQGLYLAANATKSAQLRYTKGCNKLLVCQCVLGKTLTVTQSLPFLTPNIVREQGYDSLTARGGAGHATKNDEFVL